jgi:TIGR03009 family protein
MRIAGLTLGCLLIGVAARAQQPGGAPAQPPIPGANPNAKLDTHLDGWEKTVAALTNFRFVMSLKRTDAVFKQEKRYSGVVLCMKPNFAVVRMDYDGDKSGKDYEAFICDGNAVYEYNGLQKSITRWKLPDPKQNPAGATDNLVLDFLTGMKAKDLKDRFDINLYKEDKDGYYIYLDVKPKLGKDKAEFEQLRMALYGPNTKWTYLPAQVYLVKPDGRTEDWTFKEPQTNIPGLTEKHFAYQKIDGWTVLEGKPPAPAGPPGRPGTPMLPGGNNLPAGPGAVRPGG